MKLYQQAKFLLSVATLDQLPPDEGSEVAFIGRSNAGKSSVINKLTHNKNLARVSKTPGRTQFINLFTLDESKRIADLPGYGYARVPQELREQWLDRMEAYFEERQCLKGLIVVMDIRHPLQELDQNILAGCQQAEMPVHILLNKADKLTNNQRRQTENIVKNAIVDYGSLVSFQTFSALKSDGVEKLQQVLERWF